MYEIVLHGTPDGKDQSSILPVLQILIPNVSIANFAENASATRRSLGRVLDQLKDMCRIFLFAHVLYVLYRLSPAYLSTLLFKYLR